MGADGGDVGVSGWGDVLSYEPGVWSGGNVEAYLRRELRAISDELNNAQGAVSLYTDAPSALVVLTTTPRVLDFTLATPGRDYRAVQPDVAGNAIYVRRAGIVAVSFTLNAVTPDADQYLVQLFVNDVATPLISSFDPSQQTGGGTFAALGTFRVVASTDRVADKLDLRAYMQVGVGDWTLLRGYFSVWWLGD